MDKSIKTTEQVTSFELPESMSLLQKVIAIIKSHKGNILVRIGTKKVEVSQE